MASSSTDSGDVLRCRGVVATPRAAPGEGTVMRVSHIKANVDSFRVLEPEEGRQVRDLLGRQLLDAIEAAPKNAWMPVEVDIEMTEAVGEVCGEDGVRRWSREAFEALLDAARAQGEIRFTSKQGADGRYAVEFSCRWER